ncbi:MAG TPA: thiamine biosynthesis protein ThiS [Gammaproteobacteria bacterium]|nr:thiamine biosynthesis protein ThiS [Gammaproteobacteria bacterium]
MQIILNGDKRTLDEGATVSDLIAELNLTDQRMAVEVNEELVPRSTFSSHHLRAGDKMEIVHAIGGG